MPAARATASPWIDTPRHPPQILVPASPVALCPVIIKYQHAANQFRRSSLRFS